jgi:hypothetical protein
MPTMMPACETSLQDPSRNRGVRADTTWSNRRPTVHRIQEGCEVAVVRATCDVCGDIQLTAPDVVVRVCLDDQRASYVYSCPLCRAPVARPLEHRLVELLASSGSPVSLWHLPDELSELHEGEALTHDDLLDFHQMLLDDSWLEELLD